MKIVLGDVNLGVKGNNFSYLFSYQTAGLEELKIDGKEWLYRSPKPTFWRATTCNDRGSGFSATSSLWMGADLYIRLTDIEVNIDKQQFSFSQIKPPFNNNLNIEEGNEVIVKYVYETTSFIPAKVSISYTVAKTGEITISFNYEGAKGLPSLPCLGIRFLLPYNIDSFKYIGLSGETYPDRKIGGIKGEYSIKGTPVTPYIVPQECGMHMDTEELFIFHNEKTLHLSMVDKPFPFTLLPYTALELESAYHQDELPSSNKTVLCLYAAVRGIGGINSWGADVEKQYRIDAEKPYSFSFKISPN